MVFSIFRVFKLMLANIRLETFLMKLNHFAVTQTQHFIELLALSCGQYAQVGSKFRTEEGALFSLDKDRTILILARAISKIKAPTSVDAQTCQHHHYVFLVQIC